MVSMLRAGVMDLDRDGQCQVVTCSNTFADGALRVVRNGVGLDEAVSIAVPGVRRVWALRDGALDRFVVLSFSNVTRVLAVVGDEVEQTEIGAFDCTLPTLCAVSVGRHLVQVTSRGVRLVRADALSTLVAQWTPAAAGTVSVAAGNAAGQLVLALGGGVLVYVDVRDGALFEVARVTLEHEIACVDVSALSDGVRARAALCAVGLWHDASLRLLALPELRPVAVADLGQARACAPRALLLTLVRM
jgi:DNA damage-binding protein 1